MKFFTNALREKKGIKVSEYKNWVKIEYDVGVYTRFELIALLYEVSKVTESNGYWNTEYLLKPMGYRKD